MSNQWKIGVAGTIPASAAAPAGYLDTGSSQTNVHRRSRLGFRHVTVEGHQRPADRRGRTYVSLANRTTSGRASGFSELDLEVITRVRSAYPRYRPWMRGITAWPVCRRTPPVRNVEGHLRDKTARRVLHPRKRRSVDDLPPIFERRPRGGMVSADEHVVDAASGELVSATCEIGSLRADADAVMQLVHRGRKTAMRLLAEFALVD